MRKKFTLVASLAFAAALCAGVATANVTAQAETDWANGLKVSATSVRLGTGTKEDPTGIRFKIDCPVDLRTNENAEYYTTISFTADKAYTTNVPATYWRADASGWNTLLLEIPSQYYTMDVTATAVVKLDGQEYTATATSSIAKTASIVMNGGQKDAKLDAFVAGAVTDITLSEATATLQEGETVQLTATTAPAGYGVVWASDAEEVATVAADGTITAVSAGTANITATMSGVTKTCVVTVKARTLYDFESAEQVALADNFVSMGRSGATTTYEIAENVGTQGNKALKANPSAYSAGMHVVLKASYMNAIFANADYISYDIYTDQPAMKFVRIDNGAVNNDYMFGGTSADQYTKGIVMGQAVEGGLYKYNFAVSKTRYQAAMEGKTGDFDVYFHLLSTYNVVNGRIESGSFSNGSASAWYIDNFKIGTYDANTIDFNDGLFNALISVGCMKDVNDTGWAQIQLRERVAGDYAVEFLRMDANAMVALDLGYMNYAFNTLGAQSVEFKLYSEGVAKVSHASLGFEHDKSTRDTNNIDKVVNAEAGYVTITIKKAAYFADFDTNGNYKGADGASVRRWMLLVKLQDSASKDIAAGTYCYFDDFKINR